MPPSNFCLHFHVASVYQGDLSSEEYQSFRAHSDFKNFISQSEMKRLYFQIRPHPGILGDLNFGEYFNPLQTVISILDTPSCSFLLALMRQATLLWAAPWRGPHGKEVRASSSPQLPWKGSRAAGSRTSVGTDSATVGSSDGTTAQETPWWQPQERPRARQPS